MHLCAMHSQCLPKTVQGSRKGEEEHTHRHTLKAHVEEERTRARSTYAEKEVVERIKERRNGGRTIEESGGEEKSTPDARNRNFASTPGVRVLPRGVKLAFKFFGEFEAKIPKILLTPKFQFRR